MMVPPSGPKRLIASGIVDAMEFLFCDGFDWLETVDASIVDENIEPAEGPDGLLEQLLYIGGLRDIGLDRDRLAPRCSDRGNCLFRARMIGSIVRDHLCPSLRHPFGDGSSDALGCASYDRHFFAKFHLVSL
jgi:hypothetical protein